MSNNDNNRIYITELCKIVDRKRNTIHKWESTGRLPKHLKPKRGRKNHRYWTHNQVYGDNGILAWVKANDMRPGNLITDPAKEAQHVANLRRPKYITKHHVNRALSYIERGWGAKKIAQKLLAQDEKNDVRPRYKRWQNMDRALRSYFELERMPYPPPDEDEEAVKKYMAQFDHAVRSGDDNKAVRLVLK